MVGLVLWSALPLRAQTTATPAPAAPAREAPVGSAAQATPPLERRVSLDLRDVRLETALEAINRQARLGLSYTARLVPLDKIVSISGRAKRKP